MKTAKLKIAAVALSMLGLFAFGFVNADDTTVDACDTSTPYEVVSPNPLPECQAPLQIECCFIANDPAQIGTYFKKVGS